MADHAHPVAHEAHFESLGQQQAAARIGMWVFLVSELLLFSALFTLYALYRAQWPEAFAKAVHHNPVTIGTTNTMVLITASITVAMGLHKLQHGEAKTAVRLVGVTVLLALMFLVLKGIEYKIHIDEGILPGGMGEYFHTQAVAGEAVFFSLYWLMTGLHSVHVTIGVGLLTVLALRIRRGRITPAAPQALEMGALYWHLVDAVWIFLWPLFYLTGGGTGA